MGAFIAIGAALLPGAVAELAGGDPVAEALPVDDASPVGVALLEALAEPSPPGGVVEFSGDCAGGAPPHAAAVAATPIESARSKDHDFVFMCGCAPSRGQVWLVPRRGWGGGRAAEQGAVARRLRICRLA